MVEKAVQLHRGGEVGLAMCSRADALTKLVVQRVHVVGCASGHTLQHIGVLTRDLQVFQDVSASGSLEMHVIMVGRFLGRDDQDPLASVYLHPIPLPAQGFLLTYTDAAPYFVEVKDQSGCTLQRTPGHASSPAACAVTWGTNAAVAPSTPRFQGRRYFQTHRPWYTRWCPRGPDSVGRRSPPAPCDSPEYIHRCTRRSTPPQSRRARTCDRSATPVPCHAPAWRSRPDRKSV